MSKHKTYSGNIFSGKEVPFSGISEGHGMLFRGNSVEFSMNISYSGAIEPRGGMINSDTYTGSIHEGFSGSIRCLCVGSSVFAEKA